MPFHQVIGMSFFLPFSSAISFQEIEQIKEEFIYFFFIRDPAAFKLSFKSFYGLFCYNNKCPAADCVRQNDYVRM